MNQIKSLLTMRKKTNNWLHFILTIFTFGLWTWVWVILLVQESRNNEKVMREVELVAAGL